MKLGERLQTIADMVPVGSILADIGTDHAYLPIYLVEQRKVIRAIAGDIHHGPFLSAQNAVNGTQLEQYIAVRQGNGLDVLTPGEADVVVIAGMGGANIIEILSSRPEITAKLKRIILQPMIAAPLVRIWLHKNNWRIVTEELVEEEGKLYQIIAAEPGTDFPVEAVLYEIGPLLWKNKHPLLKRHIEELLSHLRGVLSAMAGSRDAVNSEKYKTLTEKLNELEDRMLCL